MCDLAATTIQRVFRGTRVRIHRLPLILYKLQEYLKSCNIQFATLSDDGRINSCSDELVIVKHIVEKFGDKIFVPLAKSRMWYDILVFDNYCGWLPVNIKSSTMRSADNVGNLTMCVYSYTNYPIDLHKPTTYTNGEMSLTLVNCLKEKHINRINSRDYYFIVVNKNNTNDIIVNSIKGLSKLTSNIHNLPFQVKWSVNNKFSHTPIKEKISAFMQCIPKPTISWRERFLLDMQEINWT